jgi:hypothetical protein
MENYKKNGSAEWWRVDVEGRNVPPSIPDLIFKVVRFFDVLDATLI